MQQTVFHIISHLDVGGAERVAINMAESPTEGISYHVVELIRAHGAFNKVLTAELRVHHIRYHRGFVPEVHFHYLFERLAALTFPLWFLWLFLRHRPRVIHCHTEMPDLAIYWFFCLFPWLLKRCKIVRTIHNTRLWTGMERTGRRVEAFFIRHDANVAISESVRLNYQNVYHADPPIIYNGVAPVGQRPYPHLKADKINVLFAGRFEEQKGIDTLIAIIKSLNGDARYYFHVVGSGSLCPLLTAQLAGCDNVAIGEPLADLATFLAAFDFLLMPSRFEGLSILSLEASFNGLPVIMNACPGLRDTLPEDWPLQVKNNDLAAYEHLFSDVLPVINRAELQEKAHHFVEENFSMAVMRRRYEALYGLI